MASELEDTRDFEGVEAGLQSLRVKQACRTIAGVKMRHVKGHAV